MAKRPIFAPRYAGSTLIIEEFVEFTWHPGMSLKQKQRSIADLHKEASIKFDLRHPLEISSKSDNPLGVSLSSFNLRFTTMKGVELSVETAFQGSKVFERGGPYRDLFFMAPKDAKRDPRLRESGNLTSFSFFNREWPLKPRTAFYDWLYMNALRKNPALAQQAAKYDYFTDIEFNPTKSVNCQARSLAIYLSLQRRGIIEDLLSDIPRFIEVYRDIPSPKSEIYGILL